MPVRVASVAFAVSSALAAFQTCTTYQVSMTNLTSPGAGTVFQDGNANYGGDNFQLTLKPAPGCQALVNAQVYVSTSLNGADFGGWANPGPTDSSGNFASEGFINEAPGTYKQLWYIETGQTYLQATPELVYQAVPAAQFAAPASTTTEFVYLGDRALAEIHSPPAIFTDIPATASYANDADVLAADGILPGCTATTFCPTGSLTRAQLAVSVVRSIFTALNGASQANNFSYPTSVCFSDVSPSSPSFQWIQKACQLGLVAANGNFYPSQNAANQDTLGFVIRAGVCVSAGATPLCGSATFPYPSTPQYFADVPSSSANFPDVQAAAVQSIIPVSTVPGYPTLLPDCTTAGNFCATTSITRSLASMWIVRGVLGDLSY